VTPDSSFRTRTNNVFIWLSIKLLDATRAFLKPNLIKNPLYPFANFSKYCVLF
jgi:hypothetical protein